MMDYGRVTNVFVFDEDRIAIDFEDATIVYSKGNSWYSKVYIEPVTGVEIRSTIGLPNRAEFLDNLLETLREANIRKQLEAAPLDKNMVSVGDIEFEVLSPQLGEDCLDALWY